MAFEIIINRVKEKKNVSNTKTVRGLRKAHLSAIGHL